jgi:hypothetical protein
MWLANTFTSLNYNSAVNSAIENETFFNIFKSHPYYNNIVGMSELWQAEIWYNNIKNNYPDIYEKIKLFSLNDKYGSPSLWTSPDNIIISPNTLRFINTLIEIETFFNFKNQKLKIAELGIGYGGLCYVLNAYYNIDSYCLIDLPNVYKLANKYLSLLSIKTQTDVFEENSDLFISEFCLSEFDDEDIINFYNQYMLKCKNAYLHMNLHDVERKNKFLNLISNHFDYKIMDEYPKTQWPNYVILARKK